MWRWPLAERVIVVTPPTVTPLARATAQHCIPTSSAYHIIIHVLLLISHCHTRTGHQSLAITSFHVEEKIFHCPVALGCGACIVAGIQEQKMASHWHQFYAPCLEPHSPTLVWK